MTEKAISWDIKISSIYSYDTKQLQVWEILRKFLILVLLILHFFYWYFNGSSSEWLLLPHSLTLKRGIKVAFSDGQHNSWMNETQLICSCQNKKRKKKNSPFLPFCAFRVCQTQTRVIFWYLYYSEILRSMAILQKYSGTLTFFSAK